MIVLDKVELLTPAVADVFDAYAALEQMAAQRGMAEPGHAAWLGGWLVAVLDVDVQGIAALVAGAVAGAAVLAVDAQRERVKELLRYGICDFVVNDLDEALRILKNEVRKKQPVSVCLSADPEKTALEMVERGLQPEVLAGQHVVWAATLVERGALWLEDGSEHGAELGTMVTWRLRNQTAAWAAGPVLARVDELASAMLEDAAEGTALRRQWLQRAPRYLGRKLAAQRCVRMSDAEVSRLVEALGRDQALAAQMVVTRDGVAVEF
ncbi:MAG: hypothetical protein ACP5M4_04635 [Acidobacteriaceae bacterium]